MRAVFEKSVKNPLKYSSHMEKVVIYKSASLVLLPFTFISRYFYFYVSASSEVILLFFLQYDF